jgi:hypothetical protein
MRYAASCIKPYGEDGCADITTRANLQLRGVKLEDAGGSDQWRSCPSFAEGQLSKTLEAFHVSASSVSSQGQCT